MQQMGSFNDLTGMTFHRLTAILRVPNQGQHTTWRSLCVCGKIIDVRAQHLRNGNTKSCGCWDADVLAARNIKHGKYGTAAYRSWAAMIQRCTNPANKEFHNYGGRGISVHPAWRDFSVFLRDMGERPAGTSIDRIHTDKNYEPGNCRWATPTQQANNRRNTKAKHARK